MPSSVLSGICVQVDFEDCYMPSEIVRSLSAAVFLSRVSEAKNQSCHFALIFLPWIFHYLPRTAGLESYPYLSVWLSKIDGRTLQYDSAICH